MRRSVVPLKIAFVIICAPAFAAEISEYKNSFLAAYFSNDSGHPISSFTTTWVVPKQPSTRSSQSVAIWSGLEPGDSSAVLQPVLHWGTWANGGDKSWAVSCWDVTVDRQGNVVHSQSNPIPVNAGDVLRGVIELVSVVNGTYTYRCAFEGIAGSEVTLQTQSELTAALEVVETFNVTQCSEYPGKAIFKDIEMQIDGPSQNLKWQANPYNRDPLNCGLKLEILQNSAQGGLLSIGVAAPE